MFETLVIDNNYDTFQKTRSYFTGRIINDVIFRNVLNLLDQEKINTLCFGLVPGDHYIVNILLHATKIKELKLRFCRFEQRHVNFFADYLQNATNLRSLYISNCEFKDSDLYKLVYSNNNIEKLTCIHNTSFCNLSLIGLNSLNCNVKLKQLHLEEDYDNNFAVFCLFMKNLENNKILKEALVSICFNYNQEINSYLLNILNNNKTLKSLSIVLKYQMPPYLQKLFIETARMNTTLEYISIDLNSYWFQHNDRLININLLNVELTKISERNIDLSWKNIHNKLTYFMMNFGIYRVDRGEYMSQYVLLWIFHAMYPQYEYQFADLQLYLIANIHNSVLKLKNY